MIFKSKLRLAMEKWKSLPTRKHRAKRKILSFIYSLKCSRKRFRKESRSSWEWEVSGKPLAGWYLGTWEILNQHSKEFKIGPICHQVHFSIEKTVLVCYSKHYRLKQQTILFPLFWKLEVHDQSASQFHFWWELSWPVESQLLVVCSPDLALRLVCT